MIKEIEEILQEIDEGIEKQELARKTGKILSDNAKRTEGKEWKPKDKHERK